MRIDLYTSQLDALGPELGKSSGRAVDRTHDGSAGTDTADLSVGSHRIDRLAQHMQQVPEIRQELVEALRQQVQSGTYRLEPQRIADAMIADASGSGS